mmetsp:Transcript_16929/g.36773  ORF Transcript_16929/g.36773 Transcript_16929/m.36773 type:complete len:204 (+) Transcript_16929:307-918(+)
MLNLRASCSIVAEFTTEAMNSVSEIRVCMISKLISHSDVSGCFNISACLPAGLLRTCGAGSSTTFIQDKANPTQFFRSDGGHSDVLLVDGCFRSGEYGADTFNDGSRENVLSADTVDPTSLSFVCLSQLCFVARRTLCFCNGTSSIFCCLSTDAAVGTPETKLVPSTPIITFPRVGCFSNAQCSLSAFPCAMLCSFHESVAEC